jgi:hypothetical protein
MTKESKRAPDDPGFDRILRAGVRNDFPVNVLFWGNIDAGTALMNDDEHRARRIGLPQAGRQTAASAAGPAASCRKRRRGSFIGLCVISVGLSPSPAVRQP